MVIDYPENDAAGGHYGLADVETLYARVWGDSIHFGLYPTRDLDLEAATIETKRRMADLAGVSVGTHVLEVASGWGATARYLARDRGARVLATNLEQAHTARARMVSDMAGLRSRIDTENADFHTLPFADETFDVWWCQEATVHATCKPQVFTEAYRVLRPGGRMIFSDQTTFRTRCEPAELAKIAERHGSEDLFDEAEFLGGLDKSGFSNATAYRWDPHMARHFENLLARIDHCRTSISSDIDARIFAYNEDMWRFALGLAQCEKIGWSCFVAHKA